MRFVDLHSHILPGLDDGAASLRETLEILRYAYQRRTRGIVATPHLFQPMFDTPGPVELHGSFTRLTKELKELAKEPENEFLKELAIYLGSENLVSPEFLAALQNREVVALNGSRYLMVEFPPFLAYAFIESAVDQILAAELIPVLAHVERYEFFYRRPGRLGNLRQRGCVIQVNAESLEEGNLGEDSRLALALARRGHLDIIASDGHDVGARPPDMQGAFERLSGEFSEEILHTWMWENPVRILGNRDLATGS
jgi:protein-tyrosine phosphatase